MDDLVSWMVNIVVCVLLGGVLVMGLALIVRVLGMVLAL